MKKLHKFLLALPLAVLLAGCGPVDSLNPLYTDKDVVFDDALLGQWESKDGGFNFAKTGQNGYRLVMSAKDDETGQLLTMVFDAHLVSLQGHRFLDLACKQSASDDWPAIPEVHVTRTSDGMKIEPHLLAGCTYLEFLPGEFGSDDDRFTMRPRQTHWFFTVAMDDEGRTLNLVQLDDSWIDRQIEEGKLAVDYEVLHGHSAVLTASTPDLQQLVLDHVDDEEAFCGTTVMKRPGSD